MNSAISTDPGLRPWQLFLLAGMLAATGVVLVSKGQPLSSIVVLSLTVVAASLVAMAGYRSLAPLFVAEVDQAPVGGRVRAALEREKALVLRTIKEIEFDHAMGKTDVADFEEMRDRLKVRAVGLMRRLDGSDYRVAVERDLAARVGVLQAGTSEVATETAPIPSAPAAAAVDAARPCARCHRANDVDARFCKHCGASLTEGTA